MGWCFYHPKSLTLFNWLMEVNKKDLGYLGIEFQYRLVHSFMDDKKFFGDVQDIVEANMFTDVNLRNFMCSLKDFYSKYEHVPSYDMIGIEMRHKAKTVQDEEFITATIDKVINTTCEGSDSIKIKAQRFFRQQNFARINNKITELLKIGDLDRFEEIEEMWQKALSAGNRDEIGIGLTDNMEEVLSEDYRNTIATGIDGIDKTLEGGLGKGELAVIIGPSGYGKTSMTTAICNYAAKNKYKTVQIVFEDKEKQIQRKHYGKITGIEARNLSKPENVDNVKNMIRESTDYNEYLKIKKFNTGEVSPIQIRAYLKRLINIGFKPDIVVVDYFECLAASKNFKDVWSGEAHTMRQLESLASDLDIALWVPTQGTKDSLSAEIVTMDKAGGSFKKMQIAHIVISIARTPEDIENDRATIAILKNRAGKSGCVMENVYFNNGTCVIRTNNDDSKTYDSISDYDEHEMETRKLLQSEILSRATASKKQEKSKESDDIPF